MRPLSGLAAGFRQSGGCGGVIVLEKQAKVGGIGNFCEGFAAESKMQKLHRHQREQGFCLQDDHGGRWLTCAGQGFVDSAPAETLDWMDKLGIKVEYVGVGGFGGPLTWHVIAPGPDLSAQGSEGFPLLARHQRLQQVHSITVVRF